MTTKPTKLKQRCTPEQIDLTLRMERYIDNPTNLSHLQQLMAAMVNYELSARLALAAKACNDNTHHALGLVTT